MDETRWLDEAETDAWIGTVGVLMFLPQHLEQPLQEHGLSFFEYSIMAGLSDAPERRLSMGYLADVSRGSPSRLSHAIARLEDRGWVRREPSAEDGRVKLAVLTDAGLAKMVEVAPDHVASVREAVFDLLDEDQVAHLRDITTAILERVGPDSGFVRGRDVPPA